jgi:S-(hydroxymethyl)glutathione dehydrogenase/alcohol dehydrogenase
MRAAMALAAGDPTVEVVDDLGLVEVAPGFVRIRIMATGVCHSDLSVLDGTVPHPLPAVLGHEGAGIVAEVGEGVRSVAEGDHVVIAFVPPCGGCACCLRGQPNLCETVVNRTFGPRFQRGEQGIVGFNGTGTWAEELIVPEQAAVKIPDDVPFEVASLIGCGVMTGVGAAMNAAQVRPGSSVVVFGCGGVGISVIQGARLCGAAEIVAVDLVPEKHADALRFGATHAVAPDDLPDLVASLTRKRGFDYGFEAIGRASTIRAAFDAVRRGGTVVVAGIGRSDETIELNAFELFWADKVFRGTMYGEADVRTDFDRLIRLWRAGRLDLEGMVSRRRPLSEVNDALDDLRAGRVIRTVITP